MSNLTFVSDVKTWHDLVVKPELEEALPAAQVARLVLARGFRGSSHTELFDYCASRGLLLLDYLEELTAELKKRGDSNSLKVLESLFSNHVFRFDPESCVFVFVGKGTL